MKKQDTEGRLCVCEGDRTTEHLGAWEHCPLANGGHTAFIILRCQVCGRLAGFPHSNLLIAARSGTKAVQEKLLELTKEA